jgi:hypothetical protein
MASAPPTGNITRNITVNVAVKGDAAAISALARLERVQAQAINAQRRAAQATQQSNTTQRAAVANVNQFRAGVQNLGFQLQDFAVQVGGGTSAIRAFSQQAPQAIGALGTMFSATSTLGKFLGGPWGVALGVATAALSPFIGKLFEAGETAKSTTESLVETLARLKAAADTRPEIAKALQRASDEYDIAAIALEKASARLAKARETFRQVASLGEDISGAQAIVSAAEIAEKRAEAAFAAARKNLRDAEKLFSDQASKESYEAFLNRFNAGSASTGGGSAGNAAPSLAPTPAELDAFQRARKEIADYAAELGDATKALRVFEEAKAQYVDDPAMLAFINAQADALKNKLRPNVDEVARALDEMGEKQAQAARDLDAFIATLNRGGAGGSQAAGILDQIERLEAALGRGGLKGGALARVTRDLEKLRYEYELMQLSLAQQEAIKIAFEGIEQFADAFGSAISGAQSFAKAFEQMGRSILQMLAQLAAKFVILEALKALFPGSKFVGGVASALGFANGGVIQGGVQKFASGGILTGPTLFPMARGMGLAGEAGAEAIVPLRRNASGNLGVGASPVNVTVVNNAGAQISVQQDERSGEVSVIVDQAVTRVAADIARGDGRVSRSLQSAYQLSRVKR